MSRLPCSESDVTSTAWPPGEIPLYPQVPRFRLRFRQRPNARKGWLCQIQW
jgi:hypothetical protein